MNGKRLQLEVHRFWRKQNDLRRMILLGMLFYFLCAEIPVFAEDSVVLQLKWRHQFQFAGYYAALEKGYYEDAGLSVDIREAVPGIDPFQEVVSGKAQYGVGNCDILTYFNGQETPVVLANVFQHSPLMLITLEGKYPKSIHTVAQGTLMLEPGSSELIFYMRQEGIEPNNLKSVSHGFTVDDLIQGRVDAMSAYVTTEPYYLEKLRVPYQMLSPQQAGIDFYGDNLFTTTREVRDHPERVKAFRDASLKGWEYAMNHQSEIVDLILRDYDPDLDRSALMFEAERMYELIQPNLIEIGYTNPQRWKQIISIYQENGVIVGAEAFPKLLYQEKSGLGSSQLLQMVAAAFVVVSGLIIGFIIVFRINRTLRQNARRALQAELELRTIMENIDQAIAMVDADGCLAAYNKKYVAFSGYDETYLSKKPPFIEIVGQWGEDNGITVDVQDLNREILTAGKPANLELKHHGRIFEMQHRPMSHGGYVRTYSDITELWTLNDLLRKSEQKFRDLLMDLPSAITVTSEADGTLVYMNQAALEITGTDEKSAVGTNAADFWEHPEDRQAFVSLVKKNGMVTSFMTRMLRKGKPAFWVSISSKRTLFEGKPALFSIFMDMDERKRMDEELLATERRFRDLLAIAPVAIIIARLDNEEILFLNDQARRLIRYEGELSSEITMDRLIDTQFREQRLSLMNDVSRTLEEEVEIKLGDGERRWVATSVAVTEFEGEMVTISALTDISQSKLHASELLNSQYQLEEANGELKRLNEALETMASTDILTQAWNRREFERTVRIEMSRSQRYEQSLCLLMFDIDHFKEVNDRYGHLAGDVVLTELSSLVKSHLRVTDSLTRWGGEEFVVLAPNITLHEALDLAEKLRELVADFLFPEVGPITISVGVAQFKPGQTLDAWIGMADQAMYRAKQSGRNRVSQ